MELGKVRLVSSLARRDRGRSAGQECILSPGYQGFHESGIVGSLRIAAGGLHSGRYKVQGSPQRWESFVVPPSSTVPQTQKSPFLSSLSPPTRGSAVGGAFTARACRQRVPAPPVRGIPGHRERGAAHDTLRGWGTGERGTAIFKTYGRKKYKNKNNNEK